MTGDAQEGKTRGLIVIEFAGGEVAGIHLFGIDGELRMAGTSAPAAINTLADEHPDSYIAWFQSALRPYLSHVQTWPTLLSHDLEVLHLGCYQRCWKVAETLNLVDFSSPFLLEAPTSNRFPTWLIASAAGVTSSSVVRAVGLDTSFRDLTPALFEFGFRGSRWGLMPVSDPRLVDQPPPRQLMSEMERPLPSSAAARLILSNYGRTWLAFWVAANVVFGRPVPLMGAIHALRQKTSLSREVDLEAMNAIHDRMAKRRIAAPRSVDVLIVTLHRRDLLAEVLKDLAGQTEIPDRVVVVEQDVSDIAPDHLPEELQGEWPFRLDYEGVEWIGACRARNLGLQKPAGEWTLLLDDDVRLLPDFVEYLLDTATDYGVNAVTGAVYQSGQDSESVIGHSWPRPWAGFSSGCSLVSRKLILAGCRFEELLEGGFGEDSEFGVRLRLGGANVLYAPGRPAEHLKVGRGGFRHALSVRWDGERVRPRPSPTILYSFRRYGSPLRERGYRLFYCLMRLKKVSPLRWLPEAIRTHRQWRSSSRWTDRLLADAVPPVPHKDVEIVREPHGCRGMRLLVISHVVHHLHHGKIFAYGPYAREIDIWADLFPELTIAAPCAGGMFGPDCVAMSRPNIKLVPQWDTGGKTAWSKVKQILSVPVLILGLVSEMRRADAIHVRCPGNLGLLGVLLAPLFSRRLVAKYAGQWTGYPGEPWSYRLQRRVLRSWWWQGPVTVYTDVAVPQKVVPFFTSVLTAEQLARAQTAARRRFLSHPVRILYGGRLTTAKNVDVLLSALACLQARGVPFVCEIAGNGPERTRLETMAQDLGLSEDVSFLGAVSLEQMLDIYERSDVLVLASQSEGWPKAIAEAMAFGVVCIGSNRGLVPQMLGDGRGIIVAPGDPQAISDGIEGLSCDSDRYAGMSSKAAEWGRRYSVESLRDAIGDLLEERWSVRLGRHGRSDSAGSVSP